MTAKKTHDMFIEELRKKNLLYAKSQFHLLGSYTGSKEKIPCQCNVCNHEWHASPQALLAGRGCPKIDIGKKASRFTDVQKSHCRKKPFARAAFRLQMCKRKDQDAVPQMRIHVDGFPHFAERRESLPRLR